MPFVIFCPGLLSQISQMPIVLIPVHFDRDPIDHIPSCQRSVVIRTFITNDFMTGVPATPGKHIPLEVKKKRLSCNNCRNFSILFRDVSSLTFVTGKAIVFSKRDVSYQNHADL